MKQSILLALLLLHLMQTEAQGGCTDPKATNYNAAATMNNGSCTYSPASASVSTPVLLPSPALEESSGLVYTDGALWTHNDSGHPPAIYKINETNGSILQTVNITNATNTDWEDITADAQYIYIGDFGNNASGIRTNLKVYRISKSDITAAPTVNVTAAVINFSYGDQVIGASPGADNTEFDCEAFFVKDNVLHLFTKDWVHGYTKHYQLSTSPGTYTISSSEPYLDVSGLITSADISSAGQIVLTGYQNGGLGVFMYLLYDYSGTDFFSGNKRRLSLGNVVDFSNSANSLGQAEAVTFTSPTTGYIGSERFNHSPFDIPAKMYSFSVSDYISLPVELKSFTATYYNMDVLLKWQTVWEAKTDHFVIEWSADGKTFTDIGTQYASGESADITAYSYTDRQPLGGNNYYRLKEVDIDGSSTTYGIRTVKVPSKKPSINARLSSSQGSIIVETTGMDYDKTNFKIFSIDGTIIKTGRLNAPTQNIDVPNISSGTYIVALSTGDHVKVQKR